jgi:predicted porin
MLVFALPSFAQDDLLEELGENPNESFSSPAFKAMKIVNMQSTKVAAKKDWYMYVSHRFGDVSDGISTFFGLDNANTKIEMVYGLFNGVHIGLSRESLRQTYAGLVKFKITEQKKAMPFNMVGYSTININTELSTERYPTMIFEDRLSYASQLLISRRFSKRLSLQVAPTFVRQNLVFDPVQDHDQWALGLGGRFKLNNRLSVNVDYVYNISRAAESIYTDPLSIGLDIETGGHVFQLLFSNAQSTNEPGFISNAEGSWSEGHVFFGFNIVRVF